MPTQEQLDNWFSYHSPADSPDPEAITESYQALREAGKRFAEEVARRTPPSADQSDSIRKIREAVMTANAALACDGK